MAFHSKHDKHEQMMQLDRKSLMFHLRYVLSKSFFILTTGELSVNRKDLQAPTLAGPPRLYQGSGPPLPVIQLDKQLYIFLNQT